MTSQDEIFTFGTKSSEPQTYGIEKNKGQQDISDKSDNPDPTTMQIVARDKQNQLVAYPHKKHGKEIQPNEQEGLNEKLHNLEMVVREEMTLRNIQSLRYKDLCLHPYIELPHGYKIPKFSTFDGKGNPFYHLKDYCNRLIGVGHIEVIRMQLFIQSLSGLALTWYTKQDFSKWHTWEDMAQDFVEQYKFNIRKDVHLYEMHKVKRTQHESFEEYATRWRIEASKIHPPLPEEELVSTFIQIQEGIYYERLLSVQAHDFPSLIRIIRELEIGIQEGKIIGSSTAHYVNQHFQPKTLENLQKNEEDNTLVTMTGHQPPYNQNQQNLRFHDTPDLHTRQPSHYQYFQQKPYQAQRNRHQIKKMKSRTFTPLAESLTNIFERLRDQGILQPRNGWVPHSNFDPSKTCVYHSNIQGHDTEECPALKHKIQNLIEKGKITVQQEPPNDSSNSQAANTVYVQSNPSKIAPRHLKRKRNT